MAELYIRAQVAVARSYREPLTLAKLARALAVSPRQLERAYDEIGLTSFAAHLRAVRLRNAAELLAHQPLTVTDVARLVGYRQPSHFVKAFRRRFGVTPGAFRDAAHRDVTVVAAAVQAGRPRSQSSSGAGPTVSPYSNPNSVDALWPDPTPAGAKRTELSTLIASRRWRHAPTDSTTRMRTMPVPSPSSRRRPRSRTRCWPDWKATPTQPTTAGGHRM